MPSYSYICTNKKCKFKFSVFKHMSEYERQERCPKCSHEECCRDYQEDLPVASVKKGDNEITLGHLASRNTERMSDDQKEAIHVKNHAYMENPPPYKAPSNKKTRKVRKRARK